MIALDFFALLGVETCTFNLIDFVGKLIIICQYGSLLSAHNPTLMLLVAVILDVA